MRPVALALAAALSVAFCAKLATAQRACEESGYCSVSVNRPFVGDIRDSGQFRQLLDAVAFKKELIITVYMRQADAAVLWEDQVLQLHHELLDMGFAHHLVITMSQEECTEIARPTLSCVWDSSDLPKWIVGYDTALWHNRWKFVARASRMGYNVMSVDTDSMFFRDPYVHLKSPPLRDLQFICNPEGGSPFQCNGGWVYVQNARPDGPVNWVFMEVTRSMLRRADDHYQYMSQWTGNTDNCLSYDQSIILDALLSAAVGRPMAKDAIAQCKPGSKFRGRDGHEYSTEDVLRHMEVLIAPHQRVKVMQGAPDPAWLDRVGFQDLPSVDKAMVTCNLTVPNLNYGWPEELGGRLFPEGPPGEFSGPWVQMLKDDCPACPWWPEERPVQEDRLPDLVQRLGGGLGGPAPWREVLPAFIDPAIPQETWGHAPRWFSSSLFTVRRGTFLGPNAGRQGFLSVGHVHVWHLQDARSHKTMLRKVLGRYNWSLGTEVARAHQRESPYLYGHKVTRVLALSPKVDLSRTRSWAELASIITGLVQVAWLSQRVVLMPDLPCQTAWLHQRETLSHPEASKVVCLAPTFWHRTEGKPLPIAVPVDERGELIGGWARKLRAHQRQHQHQQEEKAARVRPLVLVPQWLEEDGEANSSSTASPQHTQRRLAEEKQQQTRFVSDPWWEQQRYLAVMPQLWDQPCTGDMHGIISPEFFHWLKHTPEGQRAKFQPTEANTVLVPEAGRLSLTPPLWSGPGSSSMDVPAGEAVPPSDKRGWSWWDVQVALPSVDIVREMQRVDDEPLVYLGHPVLALAALDESEGGLAAGGESGAPAAWFARLGTRPKSMTPNGILRHFNSHVQKSKCKALWDDYDTHHGHLVSQGHALRASVVDGKLHPL